MRKSKFLTGRTRAELCKAALDRGMNPGTVYNRVRRGMSAEDALHMPVQDHARRRAYFGEMLTFEEASQKYGVPARTLQDRILRRGMSTEEAVRAQRRAGRKYAYEGRPMTLRELSRLAGMSEPTIRKRIQGGMSVERAVAMGDGRSVRRRTELERAGLIDMNYPIDKERLAAYRAYLEGCVRPREYRRDMTHHMVRFAELFDHTSRQNFEWMDEWMMQKYQISTVRCWHIAYLRYQEMHTSGFLNTYVPRKPNAPRNPYVPREQYAPRQAPRRRDGRSHKIDLSKPGAPAAYAYDLLFRGVPPEETRFRQSGEGEWRFEGDAILYIVTLTEGGCTLEAYGKKDRRRWMKREYRITEGGRMELKQA